MTQAIRTWQLGPGFFVSAPDGTPLSAATDLVFGRMLATRPAPETALQVRLDARRVGVGWQVCLDDLPVVRASSDNNLPPVVEGTMTACAVRTRTDSAAFHAGLVEIDGRAVMLPGEKGSGKSTLALWLAQHGAKYLSDEVVFVRFDDRRVEGFPKAATLKEGSFPLFSEAPTWYAPLRGMVRYYDPPSWLPPFHALPRVDLIVVPRYQPASGPTITPLAPHETALVLAQVCFGGLGRDPRILGVAAELASVPARLLEYPSAEAAGRALAALIEEIGKP